MSCLFKRNGAEVDAEMRAEMVSKLKFVQESVELSEGGPILSQLTDAQLPIWERCTKMAEGLTEAEKFEKDLLLHDRKMNTLKEVKEESLEYEGMPEDSNNSNGTASISSMNSQIFSNDQTWTPISTKSSAFVKMFVKKVYDEGLTKKSTKKVMSDSMSDSKNKSTNELKKESVKESTLVACRSDTIIDCSAEEVIAWQWEYMSNDRINTSIEEKNPCRLTSSKRSENDWTIASIKATPPTFKVREFVVRQIWCVEKKGTITIASESCNEKVDWGASYNSIVGFTRILFRCETLTPLTPGGARCKVSIYQVLDGGASLPVWVKHNYMVASGLNVLNSMRRTLYDSKKHDEILWENCANNMINYSEESYSPEEEEFVKWGAWNCKEGIEKVEIWKNLNSPDPSCPMKTAFKDDAYKGYATAQIVINASKERCAAYDCCVMSNERVQEGFDFNPMAERAVIKENNHSQVFQVTFELKIQR